ncbi:MAG: hypothetical protein KDC87_13640 [Planctomycetes bacterium]|nr:hypothetical protein [Planctomycetota bacterium]MCB9871338.1 hypothetical protein [Planctomycetota bacterium]MCB9888592.1 hypothetical protein [Planctomycetota bacterium]
MSSLPLRFAAALVFVASSASAQQLSIASGQKIAFLGDSITQAGARAPAGYCRLVVRGLALLGTKVELIPAGISGHKSNQMLARLERDVLAKKPDWMTLSCGVNDVWHGKRGVELPEYRKNITAIVERAQTAGIKVMILTATMIHEDADNEQNKKLAGYNAFLCQLAKDKGCVLADLNGAMQAALLSGLHKPKGNQLTTDGVHMNTLGNIVMALGVLRGFGLDEAQLARCRAAFDAIPASCGLRVDARVTAAQYRKLLEVAGESGVSVADLLAPAVDARIRELTRAKQTPRREVR